MPNISTGLAGKIAYAAASEIHQWHTSHQLVLDSFEEDTHQDGVTFRQRYDDNAVIAAHAISAMYDELRWEQEELSPFLNLIQFDDFTDLISDFLRSSSMLNHPAIRMSENIYIYRERMIDNAHQLCKSAHAIMTR